MGRYIDPTKKNIKGYKHQRIFDQYFWDVKTLVKLLFFVYFFVQNYQVGSLVFSGLNLVPIFKIWCNLVIFVKFLEMEQWFFIKIHIRIMSIILIKQIILIHHFHFDEKTLIWSKKCNEKNTKLYHFLKNWDYKLRLKNMEKLTWYFWMKIRTKRVILNFLYKIVKILYLIFYDNKKSKSKIIVIIIILKLNINNFYSFMIINFHL